MDPLGRASLARESGKIDRAACWRLKVSGGAGHQVMGTRPRCGWAGDAVGFGQAVLVEMHYDSGRASIRRYRAAPCTVYGRSTPVNSVGLWPRGPGHQGPAGRRRTHHRRDQQSWTAYGLSFRRTGNAPGRSICGGALATGTSSRCGRVVTVVTSPHHLASRIEPEAQYLSTGCWAMRSGSGCSHQAQSRQEQPG